MDNKACLINKELLYSIRRKELEKVMVKISEPTIQKTFKDWCDKQPFILKHWHVPNGMTSNAYNCKMMKRQGLTPGVWDYWLILENGVEMVIEFKTEVGKLSDAQIEFEKALTVAQIPHRVCRSSHEAVLFVKEMLK